MSPYVMVGNGVAAVNAVEAIRARGDNTPILILTDQECAFYSRPCLYYIMLGRIDWDDAWGRPQRWYEEHRVELRCNTKATRVDPHNHRVDVEGGASIGYSKLLLAAGTRGRVLPWADQGLRGVVTLNTLLDVIGITELLGSGKRAVVAGGGLTSIELVESCRHWGIEATFVMRGKRFLDRQLTDDEAELIHRRLRADGVDTRTGSEVAALNSRDGRVVSAVLTSGEEIGCDTVACAVGVVPNKELAQEAGAETQQGIVTDDRMRTTLPDVWAAGDVVQVRGPDGTAAPSEMLWYVAADMGRVAGASMAGGEGVRYTPRVFLNVSEFAGLDFAGVGQIVPGQPDVEEHVIADRNGAGSTRLVMRDGVLIGACFLGDIRLADIARGVIAGRVRPSDLRPDHPVRLLLERESPSEALNDAGERPTKRTVR